MKKVRFALLALGMLMIMVAPALAADPTNTGAPFTFTESTPENPAIPTTPYAGISAGQGSSAWTYKDASDGTSKTEGSYTAFENTSGIGSYTTDPHGGYSTTSNKCKTCHAVHRASGAFALMRVDNPDDACSYCHIGAHRHAASEAYFGGTGGIYSSNGHTIGSGKDIPDSSVWQWAENVTLTGADGTTATVAVRRYLTARNKIMRYVVHGNRMIRVGPTNLRCMSCHQVHNAPRQIWQPLWSGQGPSGGAAVAGDKMTAGYKLLRNSPSGGISVNAADAAILDTGSTAVTGARALSRLNHTYYDPGVTGQQDSLASASTDYRLKVVEATIDPVTGTEAVTGTPIMGSNITGYTPWKYVAPTNTAAQMVTAMPVYEVSMSFWCADCHNLNIAGKSVAPGFGTGRGGENMLGDRSHAVPSQLRAGTVTAAGTHCSQCHNSDMPLDGTTLFTGADCGGCHVTTQMYHYYKNGTTVGGSTWATRNDARANNAPVAARSDWPHAGPDWGFKLLNARDRRLGLTASNNIVTNPYIYSDASGNYDTQGSAFNPAGGDGLDKVCKTCHSGFKNREIGYDK